MSLRLNFGQVPFQALTDKASCLSLIHGGAGPADPKGKRSIEAYRRMDELAETLRSLSASRNGAGFPPHILHELPNLTVAELQALHGARLLEEDPMFNAGRGSALQRDGEIRVSASFMESTRRVFSAVMNASQILHPSQLAYRLQFEKFNVLDSLGAGKLADSLGVPREDLLTSYRQERWEQLNRESVPGDIKADRTGTIGCVSVNPGGDGSAQLAAVTSTGGTGNETPGRIGDSPTIAGNYCSGGVAVSCTGIGEQIVHMAFAPRLVFHKESGLSLKDALHRTLSEAEGRNFQIGAISVAFDGKNNQFEWAAGCTTPHFAWAAVTPEGIESCNKPT